MAAVKKRVFYLKYLMDPVYTEIFAKRPDAALDNLDNCTTEEEMQPILTAASCLSDLIRTRRNRPEILCR